ncbi:unnamed protein product [Euphydryas editha]|uniref:Activin types I and II receptor domain-containing protein n=1 Tax=Euphydryas editha TaxID=104508 RepID=A0AAU9V1I9_EUPED|nr:unnamed protein product [Euphydryas editha]
MFLFRNVIMDSLHWRKCLHLLILFVFFKSNIVNGLKCYCNSDSPSCPNSTCDTDGFCYASSTLENGEYKNTYQVVALSCMHRNVAFPPDYPIKCRQPRAYCCSKDFCNSDEVYREIFLKVLHASSMGTENVRNVSSGRLWVALYCDVRHSVAALVPTERLIASHRDTFTDELKHYD